MKYTGRNIIWLIVIGAVFFGCMQYLEKRNSQKGIAYSYFASDEFKVRINYTLDFIQKNYPEEYRLIRGNVRLIKEPNKKALHSNGLSGASYAMTDREEDDVDYGLISLLPEPYHCPPSLMQDKYQLIACASVIYHEALHHYHAINKLYQSNSNLEHYHVYKRQYEFVQKMGGDIVLLTFLKQRVNDLEQRAQ